MRRALRLSGDLLSTLRLQETRELSTSAGTEPRLTRRLVAIWQRTPVEAPDRTAGVEHEARFAWDGSICGVNALPIKALTEALRGEARQRDAPLSTVRISNLQQAHRDVQHVVRSRFICVHALVLINEQRRGASIDAGW